MKKNTLLWISGIILVAMILLFVPSILTYGRGDWMHDQYGMMGSFGGFGMMGGGWGSLFWIFPIGILILTVAAGVILGNSIVNRNGENKLEEKSECSNCSKTVNSEWVTCPYCSTAL